MVDREENEKLEMIHVKKFYDTKYTDKEEIREQSDLIFLRTFNNWVKSCLIDKSAYKLYSNNLSVLDLCCGKGGDLQKYIKGGFKIFVGVDNSLPLLKNALDRLKNKKDLKTKCIFVCRNVNEQYIFENDLLKNYYFDIVSCQFSMHYHFETDTKLRLFLKNVTSKLTNGGYFIGTIIDSEVIQKRLKKTKNLTFGNEIYQIKFNENEISKATAFGKKYGFYLEGLIGEKVQMEEKIIIKYVEEYLIDFDNFCIMAKEYDLHLKEKRNFSDFYKHQT